MTFQKAKIIGALILEMPLNTTSIQKNGLLVGHLDCRPNFEHRVSHLEKFGLHLAEKRGWHWALTSFTAESLG
jgi:hypothetical protein